MWYLRTLPNIKKAFASIWGDDDLLVSFDGCGVFRPIEYPRERGGKERGEGRRGEVRMGEVREREERRGNRGWMIEGKFGRCGRHI